MILDLVWRLSRPLLFAMDAETAHRLVVGSLARTQHMAAPILRALAGPPDPSLRVELGPLTLAGPVGLAAGLDKDGEAIRCWSSLGFGFIEVGTVTAHAQPGNPKPRLFRLPTEQALINRMGFNNSGSAAMADRLRNLRERDLWPKVPTGANIGKSKITPLERAADDYQTSTERLADWVDFFTVNVSSPNTPGLRELQHSDHLVRILGAVIPAAKDKPVFLKLAPDLTAEQIQQAVNSAVAAGVSGIIATNTTLQRPGTTGRLDQHGGMSGAPLWPLARERIGQVVAAADGRVPVVGVGGVHSASQVEELLEAGCTAVQFYSGMIFHGPGLVHRINGELATKRLGMST